MRTKKSPTARDGRASEATTNQPGDHKPADAASQSQPPSDHHWTALVDTGPSPSRVRYQIYAPDLSSHGEVDGFVEAMATASLMARERRALLMLFDWALDWPEGA